MKSRLPLLLKRAVELETNLTSVLLTGRVCHEASWIGGAGSQSSYWNLRVGTACRARDRLRSGDKARVCLGIDYLLNE